MIFSGVFLQNSFPILDDVFVEFARREVTNEGDGESAEHNNPLEQKEIEIIPRNTTKRGASELRRQNSDRLRLSSSEDQNGGIPLLRNNSIR